MSYTQWTEYKYKIIVAAMQLAKVEQWRTEDTLAKLRSTVELTGDQERDLKALAYALVNKTDTNPGSYL